MKPWQVWLLIVPVFCLVLLLISGLIVYAIAVFVYSICLHLIIWAWWCVRGRDVLFVHSDSPIWREYVEQRILPHLQDRAYSLNWSQRAQWRVSLATLAFRHFGGYREFNPIAIVFRPFRRTQVFRFWKPFRELAHGNPQPLQKLEDDFLATIA